MTITVVSKRSPQSKISTPSGIKSSATVDKCYELVSDLRRDDRRLTYHKDVMPDAMVGERNITSFFDGGRVWRWRKHTIAINDFS